MSKLAANLEEDTEARIATLICTLRETEQELQTLTGGQIDAVTGTGGQPYLLQEAQGKLRQSEAAHRQLAETLAVAQRIAHLGSWELDLADLENIDGNPLRWSDEMFRIAGYVPGAVEVTNELFFRLAHPEDHKAIRQAFSLAIRERSHYSIIHRLIRPDGTERIVHETALMFFDEKTGKPLKMVGTAHDITEQSKAVESLRLFRALIDQSNDAIEVIDPQTGRFLDLNAKAWQRSGYTREEMLSMTLHDLAVNAPAMPLLTEEIRKIGFKTVEGQHRRKDGSTFPIEANVQYIDLNRGYLVAVVRDITDRKRTEDKVANQLHELQRWREVTLGREDRVQLLKKEVNDLLKLAGSPLRYAEPNAASA